MTIYENLFAFMHKLISSRKQQFQSKEALFIH